MTADKRKEVSRSYQKSEIRGAIVPIAGLSKAVLRGVMTCRVDFRSGRVVIIGEDAWRQINAERAALGKVSKILAELEWYDPFSYCPVCEGKEDGQSRDHRHSSDCLLKAALDAVSFNEVKS